MKELLLKKLEELRNPNGVFIAAPTEDYNACWMRDQLYTSFSYYYLGDFEKLAQGIRVVLDTLHKYRWKIERAVCYPPKAVHEYIHAKYAPDTLEELTAQWGHHQLDAIGLLLHIVADLDFKNINVLRNGSDHEIIQLLVFYLLAVKYWGEPDFGMWEDNLDMHTSSIGAVVAGLSYIKRRHIAVVPDTMINLGQTKLTNILPNETMTRGVDMAQLSLIWPYNIVTRETAETILQRTKGMLAQKNGLNRYWSDNYFRSSDGISGEWPLGFFWLSIIASQRHNLEEAEHWLAEGLALVLPDGSVPEIYQDGKPNLHTPLAWAQSFALIAMIKLEQENNISSIAQKNILADNIPQETQEIPAEKITMEIPLEVSRP